MEEGPKHHSPKSALRPILAALAANLGIAIAKFVGFMLTQSSSMLAESVHSLADTGNQVLLLIGTRSGSRKPTALHPFGYGRDRFFWAFFVAVILFTLGGVFAVNEAIHKLRFPEELESPTVAILILVVAAVFESLSLRTAIGEANESRGSESWIKFIRRTKSPELAVVLLEDSGALIGLAFAFGGVTLSLVTGNPTWDAYGTLAIGLLLGVIAVTLGIEMRSLLIGESATAHDIAAIRDAIEATAHIDGVVHMRTEHLGPDELLVGVKVTLAADCELATVADAIDQAEAAVRAAVPAARVIYIEPDLARFETQPQ